MEIKNNKSNRVFKNLISGTVLILCCNFLLLVPNVTSYSIWGRIILAAACFAGLLIMYQGSIELYKEHQTKKTRMFNNIVVIGVVLYALVFLCWIGVLLSDTELKAEVLSKFAYIYREAIEINIWLSRIRDLYTLILLIYNFLICVTVFSALVSAAALDEKIKKKVRVLEVLNFFIGILCLYLINNWIDDLAFNPVSLLFSVYMLWLCFCISYMREHIYFSNKIDSGSIFNRIPEDEYQDFLEKMK